MFRIAVDLYTFLWKLWEFFLDESWWNDIAKQTEMELFPGRLMTLSVSLSFIQSAVACCYKGGVVNTNEKQSSFSKHHLLSDKKGKKE